MAAAVLTICAACESSRTLNPEVIPSRGMERLGGLVSCVQRLQAQGSRSAILWECKLTIRGQRDPGGLHLKVGRWAVAVVALVLVAGVLQVSGAWQWILTAALALAKSVNSRHGINLPFALMLFGIGEIVFCGSIAMMLLEAGQQVTWRQIRTFKIRSLNLGSPRMAYWLWVNRASWIAPWLVVIVMSMGRVPVLATIAAMGEVAATFGVGVLLSFGLKMPWWNEDSALVETPRPSEKARLRIATEEDVPALVALEREVWSGAAASDSQLRQRIRNVPRGNIVALAADGRICGYTSFCLLDYASYETLGHCSWDDLSGHGTASTHVRGAPDVFGINLAVAGWAPRGASIQLLGEVGREGLRMRGRRAILGARMPGFHKYTGRMTAQEYWKAERRPGVPLDPELRFYYKFGMRPIRLVEEYFEDPESLNWGVIVERKVPWLASAMGPVIAALPIDIVAVLERIA